MTALLRKVLDAVENARKAGGWIVMTNGCFDVLHPGHVRALRDARAHGTHLLVAVNNDASVRRLKGPERPIFPLASRIEMLEALKSVDWVVAFGREGDDTPLELIKQVRPDVLVKGADYRIDDIVGGAFVRGAGGRVLTVPHHDGWSSTEIIVKFGGGALD